MVDEFVSELWGCECMINLSTHLIGLFDRPIVRFVRDLPSDLAQQFFIDIFEIERVLRSQRVMPSPPRCGLVHYQSLLGRFLRVMPPFVRSERHPKP